MTELTTDQTISPISARFRRVLPICLVLLAGAVLQFLIATQTGHESDLIQFQRWAYDLAHRGPWEVLQGPDFNIDHLPGFLLFLWLVGESYEWFHFSQSEYLYVLKIPAVVANLAGALLLYLLLHEKGERVRLFAAAVYLVLPTALLIGPLWGQSDAIGAAFLLLTIYLFDRDRPVPAAGSFTLGFFIKAQIAGALPVFVFWGICNYSPRVWAKCALSAGVTAIVLTLPFFPTDPWEIFDHIRKGTEVFDFNASFTFNFWSMFGWFRSDSTTYLGIEWRTWGIFLVVAADLAILLSIRRATDTAALSLGVSLSMLALYVFLTRVHSHTCLLRSFPCWLRVSLLKAGSSGQPLLP